MTIFPSPSPCHQFFLLILSVKGYFYTEICLLGLKDLESLLLQADAWQDKADAWQDKEWWLFSSLSAAVLLSVAVPESGFASDSFPFFQRDRVVWFPHPKGSCLIQTASRQQARRAETELIAWSEPCVSWRPFWFFNPVLFSKTALKWCREAASEPAPMQFWVTLISPCSVQTIKRRKKM